MLVDYMVENLKTFLGLKSRKKRTLEDPVLGRFFQ